MRAIRRRTQWRTVSPDYSAIPSADFLMRAHHDGRGTATYRLALHNRGSGSDVSGALVPMRRDAPMRSDSTRIALGSDAQSPRHRPARAATSSLTANCYEAWPITEVICLLLEPCVQRHHRYTTNRVTPTSNHPPAEPGAFNL